MGAPEPTRIVEINVPERTLESAEVAKAGGLGQAPEPARIPEVAEVHLRHRLSHSPRILPLLKRLARQSDTSMLPLLRCFKRSVRARRSYRRSASPPCHLRRC
ncbi:hypothetical protein Nepgr_002008 [Nepenthes gracilis]|uniref:Uncharacterized protein n=1 Tax=Nepenthes gracilis TaxID=150966 RepID=A0AAD3RXH7_NEPGR|nr:hypothetical protein Nepgr_002008 [Nepenthes gracilis]